MSWLNLWLYSLFCGHESEAMATDVLQIFSYIIANVSDIANPNGKVKGENSSSSSKSSYTGLL